MTTEETIKDIRKRCRLAMNGVASTNMRQHGLTYKVNFGVALAQIKELAQRYEASAELAEKLWTEDTRELKILATMLYPIEQFKEETASTWAGQVPNQEIREQICINLLQNLDYAERLSEVWTNIESEDIRATGYWLLARLLLSQKENTKASLETFPKILSDIKSDNVSLRNAALLATKHIGRKSEDSANKIMNKLKALENSNIPLEKEIFESLEFEFDYYFNK